MLSTCNNNNGISYPVGLSSFSASNIAHLAIQFQYRDLSGTQNWQPSPLNRVISTIWLDTYYDCLHYRFSCSLIISVLCVWMCIWYFRLYVNTSDTIFVRCSVSKISFIFLCYHFPVFFNSVLFWSALFNCFINICHRLADMSLGSNILS